MNVKNIVKNQWFTIILLGLALIAPAPAQAQSDSKFDHEHKAWASLLKKHVALIDGGKASQVRYDGFAKDRGDLKNYLATLSKVTQAEFNAWNKPQQMAFLINAYNAFTVEKILTRHPNIKSIWDFGKVFGNPFKDKFFTLFGREFTLDGIEHDTLRKPGAYDEPRVHFAVNCASVGCPMLREEPFVAARLDAQLEEQTRRFLSDRSRNRYSAQDNALEVSEIFKWFSVDWTSSYRGFDGKTAAITSREQWFGRYAALLTGNAEQQKILRDGKAAIRHLDYDWTLNNVRP